MTAFSDYAENLAITWLLSADSATRPTAWFASLHTAAPGDTGTAEISTASNYTRQTIVTASAGTGTRTNTASIVFGSATTSSWGAVSGVGIWDATTAGNLLFAGTLATARTIGIGDTLTIASGALSVTLA